MFKKEFQGGESVEVFSAQGKDPTARWHLHGGSSCIQKVFARDVRGFVYTLEGSPQMTRMQLPKDSHQQLSLLQPYLAVQLNQAAGSDCSLELLVQDLGATRRRLYLSTAQREVAGTQLHARLPLASLPRSVWCVLVLDLASLSSLAFPGSTFSSLEGVAISASCRLRKILTLKTAPLDGFASPRAFQLPPDVAQVTHLLDAIAFRPQDAGPGDQLAGASASRAGSARGAPPESHIAFGSRMPGRAPPSGRQAISARAREPNTAATHRQVEDQAKEPCPPLRPSPGRRAPLVASPARRAQGSPHQPGPPQREPSGERAGGGRSGSSRRNRIEGADPDRVRLQGNSPTVTSLVTRSPVMQSPEMSPVMRSPEMSPVREMLRISIPVSTPSQSTDGWKFPKHLGDDLDFHWGRRPLPRPTPDPRLHLNLGGLDSDGGSYEGNEFEGDAGGGDTENDAVGEMVGDTGSDDENHASLGPDSEREGGALLDPKYGGSTMTKMFTFSSVPRAVWERGGCSPSTSPAPSPSSSLGPLGLGHHFGASPLRAGARLPAPPIVAPTPSSGLPIPSQGLPSTALPSTGPPSTGLPSTALPSANANASTNGAGEMGAEGPGTGGRSGDPGWTARITRRSLREVATPRATTNRNGAVPPSWALGTAGVHRAPLGPPDSLEASVLASLHRQQLAEARGEWGGGSARGPPVGHECALMSFGSDSERSLSSDDAGSCVLMGPGTPVGSRYQQEMQLLLSRRTGDEEDLAQSSTRGYSPPIILPSERMHLTTCDSVHSSQDAAPAGEEDMLELLYDPCLDCYFDPVSGKYYQLRD